MACTDYEYDVFFSYRRDPPILDWIAHVRTKIAYWLKQEMGGSEPRVFLDVDSIEAGDQWPQRLRDGLRGSKCLVCMWSPSYFRSRWCLSEWRSFLEREREVGIAPHGLIVPASFHDGEHYPEDARDKQFADFSPYALTNPVFWDSQRAVEFEAQLLKPFAHSIAEALKRAPAYSPNWPVAEVDGKPDPLVPMGRL